MRQPIDSSPSRPDSAESPRLEQLEETVRDLALAQKRLERRFDRLLEIVERSSDADLEAMLETRRENRLPPPSKEGGRLGEALRVVLRRTLGALRRIWQASDPAPPWDGEVRLVRGEKPHPPPRLARVRQGEPSAAENCDFVWIVPAGGEEPGAGLVETVRLLLASEELGLVIVDPPAAEEGLAPSHYVVVRELYESGEIFDPEALRRRLRDRPGQVVGKRIGDSSWRLAPPLLAAGPGRELLRPSRRWLVPRSSSPRLFEHRLSAPALPATPAGDGVLFLLAAPLGEGLAAMLGAVLEAISGRLSCAVAGIVPQEGPAARRQRRLEELVPVYTLAEALEPESFADAIEYLVCRHGVERLVRIGDANGFGFSEDLAARLRDRAEKLELVDLVAPSPISSLPAAVEAAFDLHLALSEAVENDLRQRWPAASIRRLEPPIGVDGETPEEERRETVRRELGLRPQSIVVLWWGDLAAERRPEDFVALARRRREDERFLFLMAGEGPLFGQLDDTRRLLGLENLRLGSPRHGLAELTVASDVVCSTAERDVFARDVQAALAHGRPAMAASVDVAPLLEDPPAAGIALLPGDVDAADRALETLRDPAERQRLGRAGQERAAGRPAPRQALDEWCRLLGAPLEETG